MTADESLDAARRRKWEERIAALLAEAEAENVILEVHRVPVPDTPLAMRNHEPKIIAWTKR